MSPSEAYAQTLSVLTATRAAMLDPAFQAAERLKDADERLKAGQTLLDVQQAIVALSTASLSDIASQMQANEAGLTAGITALNDALQHITKVENIINTATTLLNTVAKIIPFI